jgi:hypothetical protein
VFDAAVVVVKLTTTFILKLVHLAKIQKKKKKNRIQEFWNLHSFSQ